VALLFKRSIFFTSFPAIFLPENSLILTVSSIVNEAKIHLQFLVKRIPIQNYLFIKKTILIRQRFQEFAVVKWSSL